MSIDRLKENERALCGLLDSLGEQLSVAEIKEAAEFIDAGEYGLALLTLADLLIEENKSVPRSVLASIESLARAMQVEGKVDWDRLRAQCVD